MGQYGDGTSSVTGFERFHCYTRRMMEAVADTNTGRRTFVVGTAGHVDHGKSTLVRRLTGIDPDRLQEEKAREMTIDLGFAWLELPTGPSVSIIDVPGHERFIKNMLAGVGGLDAALLVIAADEGPMPQTLEHLAILDLLGISRGIVVISKSDLVDDDWLELVVEETRDTLAGTTFADAPILPVSAETGHGIDRLLLELTALLETVPQQARAGKARLPVDRVFSVAGFGTVVTGTLLGNEMKIGQELEVLPSMARARVRGLQSHGEKVEIALPGSRTAINLSGVDRESLQRGDVVTEPGWLRPTMMIDARLRLLGGAPQPLVQNDPVDIFVGAAETPAHVTLLDRDEIAPGDEGWVQIRLDRPIVAFEGDQFIVRQASPSITIGGGRVLNAHPKRHRRFRTEVIEELETRESGTPQDRVWQILGEGPLEIRRIVELAGGDLESVSETVRDLAGSGDVVVLGDAADGNYPPSRIVARAEDVSAIAGQVQALLAGFHKQYPLRQGMAREEVRSRLQRPARVFDAVLQNLVSAGEIRDSGGVLALVGFEVHLNPAQQELADRYLEALEAQPVAPPAPAAFNIDGELLGALAGQGLVVRMGEGVVYSRSTVERIRQETLKLIDEQGQITLAEFRDHFGSSRKYAQAVLEYFDQQRITRRIGDVRVRGSG
jgi:selenocysteine-specific elongation factor